MSFSFLLKNSFRHCNTTLTFFFLLFKLFVVSVTVTILNRTWCRFANADFVLVLSHDLSLGIKVTQWYSYLSIETSANSLWRFGTISDSLLGLPHVLRCGSDVSKHVRGAASTTRHKCFSHSIKVLVGICQSQNPLIRFSCDWKWTKRTLLSLSLSLTLVRHTNGFLIY